MNPTLAIGLGNPLMGDDGIGCRIADLLAADPRLPAGVDVISGGADLLRCSREIEGRLKVVLIDAVDDESPTGTVSVLDGTAAVSNEGAHLLSAPESLALLKMSLNGRCPEFRFLGVTVGSVAAGHGLSAALAARVPEILARVLEELK